MATGVVVAGAGGRMGVRIINQIVGAEDLTLTGALEREGFPGLGGDAGQSAGVGPLGVEIVSDPASLEGDVVIFRAKYGIIYLPQVVALLLVSSVLGHFTASIECVDKCIEIWAWFKTG